MKKTVLMLLLLCGAKLPAQTIIQQFAAVSSGAGTVSDMDLTQPTSEGSTLIAMLSQLTPGIKVESVTDDAPGGGNTYKRVEDASSSCEAKPIEIWYCEKCKAGVNELKFHLSAHTTASINVFLEVSNLALTSTLDSAAHVSDATANAKGLEAGPRIVTTSADFVIARFVANTRPTGVTPDTWTYKTSYVYGLNMPAGTHQPTLIGGKAGDSFCMSMAAFKIAAPVPAAQSKN
jgi:hypothetical protein